MIRAEPSNLEQQLLQAVMSEDLAQVQELLERGANVNSKQRHLNSATALHFACWKGHLELIRLLIENGANLDAKADGGDTPLHTACENGYLEVAEVMITSGANINAEKDDGMTPIVAALSGGYTLVAKLLIERGANLNLPNSSGRTALYWAFDNQREEAIAFLLEHGSNFETLLNVEGTTPMQMACDEGYFAVIKALIKKGDDVNAKDGSGRTPLHRITCWNDPNVMEIVNLLVENGADLQAIDNEGQTPLCMACRRGHVQLVAQLLIRGAAVDMEALSIACEENHEDVVWSLIRQHPFFRTIIGMMMK